MYDRGDKILYVKDDVHYIGKISTVYPFGDLGLAIDTIDGSSDLPPNLGYIIVPKYSESVKLLLRYTS